MADLAAFLARHTPRAEGSVVWGEDPLRITAYLGHEQPPLAYVTSVRSLVFRGDALLVLRNRDGIHIMPGGRREAGETLEETLRREVLEETSWTLCAPIMLGFMHFHQLSPKPPGLPYPHPDFVQVVYRAEAADCVPDARLPDDYEIDATFRPIADVLTLALDERLYLEAALQERSAR
jgi:ADP-ribose pyrophosphatase YjhB (NUDIX family)